ncbi:NAD-binding protein [Sulfurimonas autotrophica]|uniref:TrkA-N domain protein n=1 Tax=Sulfurimonas autotrophica (strain ATCC BAA-671 / DSM 16294 / JCM 11897 / OK10) TaxID=563040 RepID=E0USS4_SULAO|nr:NAD-binding protein [Sulfurimonas autotrophica]ADN08101.1 TrkA-N domain protein [Sulfurimonas autotrophica DSM 16294]
MNIIIAGAGKVGFNLAKTLSIGHNVTVIDKNSQALDRIQESLDILPLRGDVEDANTYKSFTGQEIDLFIAVTNIDNVNLVSAMMVDATLHVKRKFVRVQKYFFQEQIIQKKLDIDKVIFPLKLASRAVSSLLKYPKANNVKFFKYTPYKLISVMVSSITLPQTIHSDVFKIVGIERKKDFFIPDENIEILPNDLVYFFGDEKEIKQVCQKLDLDNMLDIQKCVVFGGGELGIEIARELLKVDKDVKLVEKDLKLCEIADEELRGKVSIINYKYGSHDIFEDEGLESADIFVAATNNDEYNIIKCLEAKESGIKKVVAINNEMEYYNLMHSLGIVVVRGPKMSAYNTIMEEISSTGVVIQKSYCGAKAVVFMRKVFPSSKLIDKVIKPLHVKESGVFYIRENVMHSLKEKIKLQENDLIVAFSAVKISSKVKEWIYEL